MNNTNLDIGQEIRSIVKLNSDSLPKMRLLDLRMLKALQNALQSAAVGNHVQELEWINLGPQLSSVIRSATPELLGRLAESSSCTFIAGITEEDFLTYFDQHEEWDYMRRDLSINYYRVRFASTYWTSVRDFAIKSRLDCMSIFHLPLSIIDILAESSTTQVIDFCHGFPGLQKFRLNCSSEDCLAVVRQYLAGMEGSQGKTAARRRMDESAARLLKSNHCASSGLSAKINAGIEKQVQDLLKEGTNVEDIAKRLSVSETIVSVIEHNLAQNHSAPCTLELLHEIEGKNNLAGREYRNNQDDYAKQLGRCLVDAGLNPGQIQMITGLSIHKCRRLFANRGRGSIPEDVMASPEPKMAFRIIASLFAAHYLYLRGANESNTIELSHLIVARDRMLADVVKYGIYSWPGFKHSLTALGPLVNMAMIMRQGCSMPGADGIKSKGRSMQKIFHQRCSTCGSYFVGFVSQRYSRAHECCFCDLFRRAGVAVPNDAATNFRSSSAVEERRPENFAKPVGSY